MNKKENYFEDFFTSLTNSKVVFILSLICTFVFFNMLFNNFVWDDNYYIILNPDFQSLNIFHLLGNNIFNSSGQYRAIPAIYFGILFTLFHQTSFFYHVMQLAIHITNTVLVFMLLKHFFSKKRSLFLSIFFLVHPIQVESVSFIASSDNVLFVFFGLLAVVLNLSRKISLRRFLFITVLLFLSLLTKETGILFFFPVIFYRILLKKDIGKFIISTIVIFFIYGILRFYVGNAQSPAITYVPIAQLSLINRLIQTPVLFFYYLKTLIFPLSLSIDQQWTIESFSLLSFYLPLILDVLFLLGLFFWGVHLYKKRSALFSIFIFFLIWFLFGLLIHMQIIPLDMTVADRWFYFPFIGLLGLLGVGISSLKIKNLKIQKILVIVGISIFLLFLLRTIIRNTDWYDEKTLYSHDIQVQDNYELELNLGNVYVNEKNYQEAIKHIKRSIELFPTELNYNNLAGVYEKMDDTKNAAIYYHKALTLHVYPPSGHKLITLWIDTGLSWTLLLDRKPEEAREFTQQALIAYPQSGKLWSDLAISEYQIHDKEKALQDIQKAMIFSNDGQTKQIYFQIINNLPIIINP